MSVERLIVTPEEGEQFLNLGGHVNIRIPAEATGGAFAVVEHVVPPRGGPPVHSHPETELLYVLSGRFEAIVGSSRAEVGAGAILHVPAGMPHTTRNVGESAGRQLSVYLPGGSEGFFREAGTSVAAGQTLPDFDRPVSLEGVDLPRVLAIAERYGMRVEADRGVAG